MTNELSSLIQEVEAEEVDARRAAIDSIKPYDVERANEASTHAAKELHGLVLRNYFMAHPDETELVDNEWGLRAYMQRGGRTRLYDSPAVIKADNPKLYARIEALGLLRIDDDAIKQALKEGLLTRGDLGNYMHEGERTPSLQVKPLR